MAEAAAGKPACYRLHALLGRILEKKGDGGGGQRRESVRRSARSGGIDAALRDGHRRGAEVDAWRRHSTPLARAVAAQATGGGPSDGR